MSKPAPNAELALGHAIRLAALATSLFLGFSAFRTFESFTAAQREAALTAENPAPAGNGLTAEEAADAREEKPVPERMVLLQAGCAGCAVLGLLVALVAGRWGTGQLAALTLVCVPAAVASASWSLWRDLDAVTLSKVGEQPAPWTYFVQLGLSVSLILSPVVMLAFYLRGGILDRYVARGLALPATMCFLGFLAIWIVIDLTDNGTSFFGVEGGLEQLGTYYLVQLPQMVLLVLPVTLLLSLLFTLGRMSRSNEIISMLGAGRSLFTVARPLLATGLYCSLSCLALNYHWAPKAEARRQEIIDDLNERKGRTEARRQQDPYAARGWMYRNSQDGRTWAVGAVPADLAKGEMRFVSIWWQDATGQIFRTYKASSAKWNHVTREWTLKRCKIYDYDPFGTARMRTEPIHVIPNWGETPWHVLSSSYNAEYLGVPELTTYLQTNSTLPAAKLSPYHTCWHFSWAEPFRCLFIVLMATPLGIVHSRRGVLGGVAAAIGILFSLIFLDGFFLQLGKTHAVPAWIGAWGPNLLLFAVGAFLFYVRSENKELPKFRLPAFLTRA
jgi:lipopolysaccharide export LptBFGC system permease protein LptF